MGASAIPYGWLEVSTKMGREGWGWRGWRMEGVVGGMGAALVGRPSYGRALACCILLKHCLRPRKVTIGRTCVFCGQYVVGIAFSKRVLCLWLLQLE